MEEIIRWLQPLSYVALIGICLKLVASKVNRHECHAHVDGLKAMIINVEKKVDENKKDTAERLDDVREDTRELLRRNGGERIA